MIKLFAFLGCAGLILLAAIIALMIFGAGWQVYNDFKKGG